jgi:hypothetical protein
MMANSNYPVKPSCLILICLTIFISGTPERQSSGFIFSDNLFIGLDIQLIDNLYMDIRPGFRHISNLGLQDPNWGVHSFVLSGGLLFIL